jgi:excisionase family DNA binding protein
MELERHYLKVGDVAVRLSLDVSTVYKLIKSREIPAIRIGAKAVRIPVAALDAYLRRQEADGISRAVVLRDAASTDAVDELEERVAAFVDRTGRDPRVFVEAWRDRSIEDTPEAADLALEALALQRTLERHPERELA